MGVSVQEKKSVMGKSALAIWMGALVVSLIPPWIPVLRTGTWGLIILAVQIVIVVAVVVLLVRFVRKQRDDYWRERGKDPKHPEI
jgi:heme/copper-type cytochrome/quinol oxidase subunit 2